MTRAGDIFVDKTRIVVRLNIAYNTHVICGDKILFYVSGLNIILIFVPYTIQYNTHDCSTRSLSSRCIYLRRSGAFKSQPKCLADYFDCFIRIQNGSVSGNCYPPPVLCVSVLVIYYIFVKFVFVN